MTGPPDLPDPLSRRRAALVGAAAALATLALYAWPMARPCLLMDDFQILVRSWTWERAWAELWVPANEHAMPAGRLTTWLLVELAGHPSALPWACAPQGPLAVLAGMGLAYLFVRRELGSTALALTATTLFGVTTVYQQAVLWFSASFSVLSLDTFLLTLLAAQRWRRGGGAWPAALCASGAALAPAWFASGVLAGPLCGLYLLLPPGGGSAGRRDWLRGAVPLLGTAAFLAVSLPRTARPIMNLEHYAGGDALRSFGPMTGLGYTLRSAVENLLLGAVGVGGVSVPTVLVPVVWGLLFAGSLGPWRRAPRGRRLMLLGAATAFAHYWLVYSARAAWDYDEAGMNGPSWSRYHLMPQLGLALAVAGGLTARLPESSGLTRRAARRLAGLVAVLFVAQLPRVLLTPWGRDYAAQQAALRRVEEVDALCRAHRIAAPAARAALPFLEVPGSYRRENGWAFLRGSPDPDPALTGEAARRLLTGAAGDGPASSRSNGKADAASPRGVTVSHGGVMVSDGFRRCHGPHPPKP